ncbi:MAG: hypothetical protein M3290_09820, partial [Actinomycetota bacterium]|nr:hypothetical protein [Actinomycetota bacterium]
MTVLDTDSGTSAYRTLYYRWEQEQWSAAAIDLAADALEWANATDARREQICAAIAFFYEFSRRAAEFLVALVDAAPTEEQH